MNAVETEKTKRVYRQWPSRLWAAPLFFLATVQAPAEPFATLKGVEVPSPENLLDFVKPGATAEKALVQLGKALFWDMQVGSDGVQACASCHFAAGADPRPQNQLSPGLLDQTNPDGGAAGDQSFQVLFGGGGGPNHALTAADFPFTRFSTLPPFGAPPFDADNRNFDVNDVASSQGVFNTEFVDAHGNRAVDVCRNLDDPVFQKNNLNTRRVEPRNTPTFINAVFNFRNFWDGRAQHEFNGVNPFGSRDPVACVFKTTSPLQPPQCVKVEIKNCSQCSQAVGPPRSFFEMSCDGRPFAEIGQKLLLGTVPLGKQKVHCQDSVLGEVAKSVCGSAAQKGLKVSYASLIQQAFKPEWWNSSFFLNFNPGSELSNDVIPGSFTPTPPANPQYTQMQANFSLFFGLSVGRYMRTVVSDDTPADKGTLTTRQQLGLQVFNGDGLLPDPDSVTDGLCANCHGGAETTNASVRNVANQHLERMQMGFRPTDGGCSGAPGTVGNDGRCIAVYDNGFYNIGARPTTDDVGVGGTDPFGNPLSETKFCQQRLQDNTATLDDPLGNDVDGNDCQAEILCIDERPDEGILCPVTGDANFADTQFCINELGLPDLGEPNRCRLRPNELTAVQGNFKTPHMRNLLLTGPYFHNGGKSTLEQVVRAYNHGLDFRDTNQKDLDPDIEADLDLSEEEITALVDFLACGLLEKDVAYEKAPFDHPELFVPRFHTTTGTSADPDGDGNAADNFGTTVPAVGKNGVSAAKKLKAFLNLAPMPDPDGAGLLQGVTCSY